MNKKNTGTKKTKRTLVLPDVHGSYKALKQCFERSGFDYKRDRLISLGDITDGWSQTPECIEELKKIKHLVYVLGNHDRWLWNWFELGQTPLNWTEQGGRATLDAYVGRHPEWMTTHKNFFRQSVLYYVDEENRLYVHGGVKLGVPLKDQDERYLTWDRALVNHPEQVPGFKEVFVGHTSVWRDSKVPYKKFNIWAMDTGAGWEGKLSIMDVDSREIWQSDRVRELYPAERGRG